jgi:hypothetical protein
MPNTTTAPKCGYNRSAQIATGSPPVCADNTPIEWEGETVFDKYADAPGWPSKRRYPLNESHDEEETLVPGEFVSSTTVICTNPINRNTKMGKSTEDYLVEGRVAVQISNTRDSNYSIPTEMICTATSVEDCYATEHGNTDTATLLPTTTTSAGLDDMVKRSNGKLIVPSKGAVVSIEAGVVSNYTIQAIRTDKTKRKYLHGGDKFTVSLSPFCEPTEFIQCINGTVNYGPLVEPTIKFGSVVIDMDYNMWRDSAVLLETMPYLRPFFNL